MPRRLAIPRTVTVRGRRWRIVCTGRKGRPKRKDMRGVVGLCDHATHTIWIDAHSPADLRGRTLVHEAIHAILGHVEQPPPDVEAMVERLEAGIYALIVSGALVAVPEEA